MHGDMARILYSSKDIQNRIQAMAREINEAYPEGDLVLLGVLSGSLLFLADLARALDRHVILDFIAVSSYEGGTQSTGVVRMLKDVSVSIEGRDVLLVEDIIDTGLTINYLLENLTTRHPRSLAVCALLDKVAARTAPVPIRFTGFEVPNEFLVGYGLDYQQRYRNLPYVGILKPEVFKLPQA
ncbi:MAG: hypoxanthine phosphoribosyltransferase [Candidatus Eisenbacteria bacterium]|nr:hypoxanthine phosphoribosyltransferase [Candidatus Eisenbacteria bacterium]